MSQISPRIARGAALLDQHAPGWTTKIDLETLDLGNEERCILGQVYGHYSDGLRALNGEASENPEKYGFEIRGITEFAYELTAKWAAYLRRRLK